MLQHNTLIIFGFLAFWSTTLSCITLRNVYTIEYNIRKDELSYIFRDDKILYRTMLRAKIWILLGLNLLSLLDLAGRVNLLNIYPTLYLFVVAFLKIVLYFLASLIYYLIYKKKDLDFLKIKKVGA